MDGTNWIIGIGTLLATIGMWLLLPRGRHGGTQIGAVLLLVALGFFGSQVARLSNWGDDSVFILLAATTVIAAAATVTARNPVYSAIWFALVLLGTAGLFLYQGAQFLAIATVIVYAGAILVTFLFVIMLAQPQGHAYYDRLSWEAMLSAAAGAVLVGMLTMALVSAFKLPEEGAALAAVHTAEELEQTILADQHVAHFGAQMFSKYLIAVQVAGALLLAALVGAVAIIAHGKEIPKSNTGSVSHRSGRTAHGE